MRLFMTALVVAMFALRSVADEGHHHDHEAIKTLGEIAVKEQGIFAPDRGIAAHEMMGDILGEIGKAPGGPQK